ncbi:unnamed protein product, partial [marine sediment metagenome]
MTAEGSITRRIGVGLLSGLIVLAAVTASAQRFYPD